MIRLQSSEVQCFKKIDRPHWAFSASIGIMLLCFGVECNEKSTVFFFKNKKQNKKQNH